MSITHTITRSYNDGTRVLSGTVTETAGQANNIDESIPIATNTQVAFAFTKTKLMSICILSDQDVTIKTNSTGSPAETLTILANKPWMWDEGDAYFANPFSTNVTTIYVTSAAIARLQIASLIDPT